MKKKRKNAGPLMNLDLLKKELRESGFSNPSDTDALIWGMWKDLSDKLGNLSGRLNWLTGFLIGFVTIATGLLVAVAVAIFGG